ncbi:unnamed protein product [Tilletia caries]|nr:unnamed protein product [Tilletia caries]
MTPSSTKTQSTSYVSHFAPTCVQKLNKHSRLSPSPKPQCPAHIYGAAPPQQQPLPASTARALLAAASLLELDDLAEWALAQARSSLVLDAELVPTTHFLSSSVGCGCGGGIDIPKRGGGGRE